MDYEWDIFISYPYKEDGDDYDMIEDWVDFCLVPQLKNWLRIKLGWNVKIVDGRHGIAGGDSWQLRLQRLLACSRILVPIWCPLYFNSEWCQKELSVFLKREEAFGLREHDRHGLMVPINIFGNTEEDFPAIVHDIQSLDCRDFYMSANALKMTTLYSDFAIFLKSRVSQFAETIQNAPDWQDSWLNEALPEVESRRGLAVPLDFVPESMPSTSELIREQDYTRSLARMERFIDAGELDPAHQFGQRFLTTDGYPLAALIFDHALNRIGQTHPFFSRMLANRAYSLIGLERFHEAVGCLKHVRELRAADGTFRAWHAVALAYAYFRLGKNRKYSDWLAYARGRPEEYAMRINDFAEYYPEIAEALVAS